MLRSKRRGIARCILAMMLVMMVSMPVFAETLSESQLKSVKEYLGANASSKDGSLPASFGSYISETGGDNTTEVTYTYKDENGTEQQRTVYINNESANKLSNKAATNTQAVKNNIDSIVTAVNVTPDTEHATEMMSSAQPIINIFVGLIVYGILIGLPILTALDLFYLTIPAVREKCDEIKNNNMGSSNLAVKTSRRTGETKLRWISDEAQYAVKFASYEEGKSPLAVYAKKRAGAHIVLAILITIFLTGNIQILMQLGVTLVSGLMSVFVGVAS